MTLPVILAIEGARTPEERAFWRRTIGEGVQAEGDFARAQALMERDDLVGRSLAVAQEYAVRAASSLGGLPRSPLRDTREALALASTARSS